MGFEMFQDFIPVFRGPDGGAYPGISRLAVGGHPGGSFVCISVVTNIGWRFSDLYLGLKFFGPCVASIWLHSVSMCIHYP